VSSAPLEFQRSPQVELRTHYTLSPGTRLALAATNAEADPRLVITEALMAARASVIVAAKEELKGAVFDDDSVLRKALDLAWQVAFPRFQRATGPMIAQAYFDAFNQAEEGLVPAHIVYALAEDHARRVGEYFHETSSEALISGFNTYVNRRVPARAAAERVLDAYGMTPRQISGLTSNKQLDDKVETISRRSLKARFKEYVGRSVKERLKIFAKQEEHNLSMQAQQVAWMWMVENGKLPERAQKMWLTAADEKVCRQCGPMHRKKVNVKDRFRLPNGNELYVPGAHVNCRCQARLHVPILEIAKAADWEEKEHPRGEGGRFRSKPRQYSVAERGIDKDTEERLREIQQRDAIAAAKLEELRQARIEARKKKELKPQRLEPLTSHALKPLQPLGTLKPIEVQGGVIGEEKKLSAPQLTAPGIKPHQLRAVKAAAIQAHEDLKAAAAPPIAPVRPSEGAPIGVRNAKPILDKSGNRIPVFFHGDGEEMDEYDADNRRAHFDEERNPKWVTNRDMVIGVALNNLEDQVKQTAQDLMDEYADPGDSSYANIRDTETGQIFQVSHDAMRRTVENLAWGEFIDPDPNEPIPGYWTEADGITPNYEREPWSYQELAERLNLDPEQFVQTIYFTDEGNDGETDQLEDETRKGYETWKLTGSLRILKDMGPREEFSNAPIRWVQLGADTDTQQF